MSNFDTLNILRKKSVSSFPSCFPIGKLDKREKYIELSDILISIFQSIFQPIFLTDERIFYTKKKAIAIYIVCK